MSTADPLNRRIVQTALRLAHQAGSWDAVHVHEVAREAGVAIDELGRRFEGKDAIAEGCFDIADEALLACANQPGWPAVEPRERLLRVMMAWFDALAPHRALLPGMLAYKLHPEHIHLQARGIARISRTVQWIRETALLTSTGWRRELQEAVLTSIYVSAFTFWLTDRSPGALRTRRLLQTLLTNAERAARRIGFGPS